MLRPNIVGTSIWYDWPYACDDLVPVSIVSKTAARAINPNETIDFDDLGQATMPYDTLTKEYMVPRELYDAIVEKAGANGGK